MNITTFRKLQPKIKRHTEYAKPTSKLPKIKLQSALFS